MTTERSASGALSRGIGATLLALIVAAGATGCAASSRGDAASPPAATPAAATPTTTPGTAATASPAPAPPTAAADAPVPKAGRDGAPAAPAISAAVASPAEQVTYGDGVVLRISSVTYGSETAQGAGAATGREFARISLDLTNGSDGEIDVSSTVVTVLDPSGARLVPVYTTESGARDFAGTVGPATITTAVYAVAAPADHSTPLTIVVDFDAVHTSAVFRGALS